MLFEQIDEMREQHGELERKFKVLSLEMDKYKTKIKQYRAKKAHYGDVEEKTCKLCGINYYESENYNWSCKTHPSDWGGEMYWCCGKTAKEAPGCKANKHESKEEDEDELD
jgi:hypothetical protein